MRRVLPQLFLLFGGTLDGTRQTGQAQEAVDVQQKHQPRAQRPDISGEPVALRWATAPDLGFPREPFEVWRRLRDEKVGTAIGGKLPITVSGAPELVTWTQGELYDVHFDANPLAGSTLVVEALDAAFHAIPGQRTAFTGGARGAFRSPGIAALRLSGAGAVAEIRGRTQLEMANLPDWERTQVVGLPFTKAELSPPDYDPQPQGYEAPSLDGIDAALMRLDIARTLRLPIPATGVADIPTPPWDPADPKAFLTALRGAPPALVPLIADCLRASDDADPARLQALFEVQETLPGIQQADIAGAGSGADPTVMTLPVVGVSMLGASSDSETALALGYGTTELWEHTAIGGTELVYPPGTVRTRFDYMVTAPYTFPFLGSLDLAALVALQPQPAPPTSLQATGLQANRAPALDQAATEAVQVSWALSERPAAFGVLRSRAPGDGEILNAPRAGGGHDPFVPQRPAPVDGVPPAGVRTVFTDPVAPVPLSGSTTSRYMVLALDVFARWSAWRLVAYTASAGPVQVPGLVSATLGTHVDARIGRVVPGTLDVEVVWDWSDRSPDRIELTGTFIAPTAQPPATAAADVPFGPGGPVVVRFKPSGAPFIDSGHAGTVSEVVTADPPPGVPPPEGDRRQYKVSLTGVSCDFTTAGEVAFAVRALGAEHVRPAAADLSPPTGPRVARAPDPIPPPPPALPPIELLWTALPDATGRARGVLRWPAVANATGYIVWEATEAALRRAVAPGVADPAPETPVLTRAGDLRALVTGSADAQARSLIAFSRVRDRPFTGTELELALPGSSDTLFAYRVSAITAANVESPRSDTVALFAVPRRIVPGRPRLLLRTAAGGGVDVIVVPGRGPAPAGIQVHRVRRAGLAAEVGSMGPPVIGAADPGWHAVTVPLRPGAAAGEAGQAVTDPVAPSWYPYHYRVVAIGAPDPPNGGIAGESDASAVASIVLPPTAGPLLDELAGSANARNRLVRFRTDLPVRESPAGRADIVVTAIAAPAPGARPERTPILSVASHEVEEGELRLLRRPNAAQLAAMPEIRRSAPDADGRCTYTVRLAADVADGAIGVRDPLGRSLEQALPGVT